MSLTRASFNNPYGVIALALVVVALGTFAFSALQPISFPIPRHPRCR